MTPSARPGVSAAHRARLLRALGVTPWVRRPGPVAGAGPAVGAAIASAADHACVVVVAHGTGARALGLLERTLAACGPLLARSMRIEVRDGALHDEVPAAAAYLVFGEPQAHALGRCLPVEVLQHAQIVLVDALPAVLGEPVAKRRLWVALRGLRRTLAAAAA